MILTQRAGISLIISFHHPSSPLAVQYQVKHTALGSKSIKHGSRERQRHSVSYDDGLRFCKRVLDAQAILIMNTRSGVLGLLHLLIRR